MVTLVAIGLVVVSAWSLFTITATSQEKNQESKNQIAQERQVSYINLLITSFVVTLATIGLMVLSAWSLFNITATWRGKINSRIWNQKEKY
jgi:Na+/H+ antiporter NhaC